jgi:hypothetical protein
MVLMRLCSDLSKFIANRRVSCVIDKVSGVITKTSGAQRNDKYSLYEQVLNAGDSLLNGTFGAAQASDVILTLLFRCREAQPCSRIVEIEHASDTYVRH